MATPDGDSTLERELLGDAQAAFTAEVCLAQSTVGLYWSVENPASSFIWGSTLFSRLVALGTSVYLDQCEYGLVPPPGTLGVAPWGPF